MYRRLAAPPWSESVPWDGVQVYWGDERAVPPDDPDDNYFRDDERQDVLLLIDNIFRFVQAGMEGSPRFLDDAFAVFTGVAGVKQDVPRSEPFRVVAAQMRNVGTIEIRSQAQQQVQLSGVGHRDCSQSCSHSGLALRPTRRIPISADFMRC